MIRKIQKALKASDMDELFLILDIPADEFITWLENRAKRGLDAKLVDAISKKYAYLKLFPLTTDPVEVDFNDDDFICQAVERIKIYGPTQIELLKEYQGDENIYDLSRMKYMWFSFAGRSILITPRISTKPILIDKRVLIIKDGHQIRNERFLQGEPIVCQDVKRGVMAIDAFIDHACAHRFDKDILLMRRKKGELERMFDQRGYQNGT